MSTGSSATATSNAADTEHEHGRREQDPRRLDYDGDEYFAATESNAGA